MQLEPEVYAYAGTALPQIVARLKINLQTETLAKVFTAFDVEPAEVIYEDGIPIEDESLRQLIEQMKYCSYTSDKIALMRQKISSMADFTELIEECFYEEEYEEVFHALNKNERAVLRKILLFEAGPDDSPDYEPEKPWKKKFLKFGNN
jgi:hypothetical protein